MYQNWIWGGERPKYVGKPSLETLIAPRILPTVGGISARSNAITGSYPALAMSEILWGFPTVL